MIRSSGRIEEAFKRLASNGEKALVAFITAGDPDLGTTEELILRLERSGADIIELGVPFSDPMADGPTIQASYERALRAGVDMDDVLALVKKVRSRSQVPIVLFGYYNPMLQYGLGRFARNAKKAGVDGVLVVDLPPEEAGEFKRELDASSVDLIFLLTPTSDSSRMKRVAGVGSGFVYFVSVTGVTGARANLSKDISSNVRKVRRHTDLPVGVGFGISTPGQAREVARFADAVIVGSAIINRIAGARNRTRLLEDVGSFVKGLKKGMSRS